MLRLFEGRESGHQPIDILAPWVEPEVEPESVPASVPERESAPDPEPELKPEFESQPRLRATPVPPTQPSKAKAPRQIIAFCGAAGSVGKTSVSINVAFELATAGHKVVLLDLDLRAPSLLATLNQDSVTAGLSGVFRLVDQGRFVATDLERLLMVLNFDGVRISILPGLGLPMIATKWATKLHVLVQEVIDAVDADYIVLDLPELAAAPEVVMTALRLADLSFAICSADPIGVQRYLWLQTQLQKLELKIEPQVIVNRVRDSVLGSNAKRQLADTFERIAKTEVVAFVPDDPAVFDLCLRDGLPLQLVKKASPARHAISMFVRQGILGQRSHLDWRVARSG